MPDAKVPRGTYRLNVFVVTNARAPDVIPSLGYVDFHSDRSKPATVTFDHDYPSTPGERENYEAQKREAMSSQPVYPGEQFAETGRYRLVPNAVQRSRFLQRFSAGELALGMADLAKFVGTANIEDERGQKIRVIDEGYGWVWEADSLPDVFAPDIRCDPGEPCPRSGCWFARVKSNITFFTYDDSLDEVIQCRAGQIMPTSRKFPACDRLRWEWIGA
ncbi:hypothetical protein LMG29542_06622 [Paraburkholderia humisilvae]|uniref:Uncharacterized protein n=1 Tax=Paraburkholderia humisilvae TaxID=627669 RepID=A0A6J5F1C3_9BURK|nr:hypothetical protein LMG29542_06622 [Paraburkholderia humisilvae]